MDILLCATCLDNILLFFVLNKMLYEQLKSLIFPWFCLWPMLPYNVEK